VKVIEGGFGKVETSNEEKLSVQDVFLRIADEEGINEFHGAVGFAMRDDGLSIFSTNMTIHEVYMHLDLLKDYLRNGYDEFQ
tara:strand:+ start:1567 stop:1812 length:246 start_codon:yes stop_codon:yes gene_type:complete